MLADGIYFNLPERIYRADPALGSTDIKEILKNAPRWWRQSALNPDESERARNRKSTKATIVGTALHTLVLDGRQKFDAAYVRRPDDAAGSAPADKGAITKKANAEAKANNMISLHGDEWELCESTGRQIAGHPDLVEALNGGQNEVSIFWTRPDGIRCKGRLDRLKEFGIGDLKTFENELDLRIDRAAILSISRYGHPIQAENYLEGRSLFQRFVTDGAVFMSSIHGDIEPAATSSIEGASACFQLAIDCALEPWHRRGADGLVEWFDRFGVATDQSGYSFAFIFIQKSTPDVWATMLTPGNGILDIARSQIEKAMDTYKAMLRTHGPGVRWRPTWRLQELAAEDMPAYWGRE